MDTNTAWQRFYMTGTIADYLEYVSVCKGESNDENKHGRHNNQAGNSR